MPSARWKSIRRSCWPALENSRPVPGRDAAGRTSRIRLSDERRSRRQQPAEHRGHPQSRARESSPNAPPGDANQIVADQIQLQIAIRGQKTVPTNVACNGNVAFRQIPKPGATDEPLDVRGSQLMADQLDLDNGARMIIHGAGPNEPPGSRLTEIKAHGMTAAGQPTSTSTRDKIDSGSTDRARPSSRPRTTYPAMLPPRQLRTTFTGKAVSISTVAMS